METIQIGSCPVAYLDIGRGTPVILVHCSSASHRMWTGLVAVLKERHRVLAPDLIGYGASNALPADRPFEPWADVETILRLAALVDGPVHLAGHSYGGALALEAACQLEGKVQSLTLVEPVSFHLLRSAGRMAEWDEISAVAERVRTEASNGAYVTAAATYMSYWIGRVRWWLMPRRHRRIIIAGVMKVAAEFGSIHQFSTTMDNCACLTVPTRLIVGGRTRRPARAVVDVLLATLPDAHERVLSAAGHMSPFTHVDAVRDLIVEHIDRSEAACRQV